MQLDMSGFNSLFGSSGTPETPEPPKPAPEPPDSGYIQAVPGNQNESQYRDDGHYQRGKRGGKCSCSLFTGS